MTLAQLTQRILDIEHAQGACLDDTPIHVVTSRRISLSEPCQEVASLRYIANPRGGGRPYLELTVVVP